MNAGCGPSGQQYGRHNFSGHLQWRLHNRRPSWTRPLRFTATPQGWLFNSVLAPHAIAYAAYLRRGRYAATTVKGYVAGIAHFARWMTACYLPVRLLDEHTVEQFLGHHLPRCDCPAPVMRVHGDLRAALGHLLSVLREQGAIAEPRPPTGHIADELRRYDEHMRDARGLTAGTRRGRLRTVQRLLLRQFAGRPCSDLRIAA